MTIRARLALSLARLISLALAVAGGGTGAQAVDRPWDVPISALENLTSQVYSVPWDVKGQSMWMPGSGVIDWTRNIETGNFAIGPVGFGGFFNPCIPWTGICAGEFGAAIGVRVNANAALRMQVLIDTGSVDISYPSRVQIDWPLPEDVHAGADFTIRTRWYPSAGATMRSHSPSFMADARFVSDLDFFAGVQAKTFGKDLFTPIDLFDYIGRPPSHFEKVLFHKDSDELTSGIGGPFVILPKVLWGEFHIPKIDAVAGRGTPENVNALRSFVQDDFVSMNGDVTNAAVQLLGYPPFNGPFGGSSFSGEFRLIDLYGGIALGVTQQLTFNPAPRITFRRQDGSAAATITAGETATIRMPASGDLTLTPVIEPRGSLRNATGLRITPELYFELLKITAKGSVAGYNLGSLTIHPVDTITILNSPIDIPLVDTGEMTVTSAPAVTGAARQIQRDTSRLRILSITPKVLDRPFTAAAEMLVQGQAAGNFTGQTKVLINGIARRPTTIDGGGNFRSAIPCEFITKPGAVAISLFTPAIGGLPDETSNPVDFHVLSGAAEPGDFASINMVQTLPSGTVTALATAGSGTIQVQGVTRVFQSVACPPEEYPQDSTLTWNGMPIRTTVTAQTTSAVVNGQTVYNTVYTLTGEVTDGLQVRGGGQALGVVKGGARAPETALQSLTVRYPVPSVVSTMKIRPPQDIRMPPTLVVHGSGFTPESIVLWDGSPRQAQFVSASMLAVSLSANDWGVPGDHSVEVANPEPGGGVSGRATMAVAPVGPPEIAASHNFYYSEQGQLHDTITLTNIGASEGRPVRITNVSLVTDQTSVQAPMPVPEIEALGPGDEGSIRVPLPLGTDVAGRAATVTVDGMAGEIPFQSVQTVWIPPTLGDANNDGLVDVRDVALLLRMAGGLDTAGPGAPMVGDFNQDGHITMWDVAWMLPQLEAG